MKCIFRIQVAYDYFFTFFNDAYQSNILYLHNSGSSITGKQHKLVICSLNLLTRSITAVFLKLGHIKWNLCIEFVVLSKRNADYHY